MRLHFLTALLLLLAAKTAAQIKITDVVNAGNRIASGKFSSGLAQGAVFAVTGKQLGPAGDLQRAAFPLPTTDGLGGVTMQANVADTTVDVIMVYVSENEIGGILPSSTPLGAGVLTVNNNGDIATKAINVVASAFGIFRLKGATYPSQAMAFNVTVDADNNAATAANNETQSAQPGQDVVINGTGLGAITSDETQSGVSEAPATTAVQVWVGIKPATIVSAGRAYCCDGLDPDFPIPPGVAAWDVIRFTVPDEVVGCFIPVIVQTGGFVSNIATISISPDGSPCIPPASGLSPELAAKLANQTGVSIGNVSLSRTTALAVNGAGVVNTQKRDNGSGTFVRYPDVPASIVAVNYQAAPNTCSINAYPDPSGGVSVNGNSFPIIPLKAVSQDAGPAITVTGPSGVRTIVRLIAGAAIDYGSTNFGNSTPGNYYDPGHYTATAPGGRDIGSFKAETDFPPEPFVWTNFPTVRSPEIDRSKDYTIKWTGGAPGSVVIVTGANFVAGVTSGFQCNAPVNAGQITIPSYALLSISPSGPIIMSGLGVLNPTVSTFTASGLDVGTIRYSVGYSVAPKFQ